MKDGVQLTPRVRKMSALVEKYLGSGLPQKSFCEQEGIAFTTLQYWLKCYRAHQGRGVPVSVKREGFIPLQPESGWGGSGAGLHCIIEYPNGVVPRLSGISECRYCPKA